ncbi:MAG: hypothetical protein M3081_14875 [Gemmatimonadota bacterium]|nr:hypothetical protein [Gemmatimonadota bacterium]
MSSSIAPELARRIRLVGLDVDGVLTDGGIYLGDCNGERVELKRYDIQDGLGIRFLHEAGVAVAIVTGRESASVRMRAAELGIDDVEQDRHARKLPAFHRVLTRRGIAISDAAFLSDDIPDLAILREVGLPVAVGNAVDEVRAICALTLERRGGAGAVREFAECLLKARGDWEAVIERYIAQRSAVGALPGAGA